MMIFLSVTALAIFLVSSAEGFSSFLTPRTVPGAGSRRFSTLESEWTIKEQDFTASFSDDSLSKASKLAGNLLPEADLLGNVEQQQATQPKDPADRLAMEESGYRKTKISASVKETGYDSINNYMVRPC